MKLNVLGSAKVETKFPETDQITVDNAPELPVTYFPQG